MASGRHTGSRSISMRLSERAPILPHASRKRGEKSRREKAQADAQNSVPAAAEREYHQGGANSKRMVRGISPASKAGKAPKALKTRTAWPLAVAFQSLCQASGIINHPPPPGD